VAPEPHICGTSRMFQIMGAKTRPQLHVVRSANEAYEQLQVVEPKFKPIPED